MPVSAVRALAAVPPGRRFAQAALAAALAGLAALLIAAPVWGQTNPVLTDLVERGIEIPGGKPAKLPSLTLPDGLDAAGQRKAIGTIADERRPVEAILMKSLSAPFVLRLSDDEGAAPASGAVRRVDLWFVAYGDMERIRRASFLKGQFESSAGNGDASAEPVRLTEQELRDRKIPSESSPEARERYVYSLFPLLDKVQIAGTSRTMETQTSESALFAGYLDPRFAADEKYPNRWRPLSAGGGRVTLGTPQPYGGSAAYAKATMLIEPEGAVFIEYHAAFYEPPAWFGGTNLLPSKLPIKVQDEVRKFRRRLGATESP
jgi:hypothetical protein